MSNKKLYGKVLKFKDLNNKSYEVDVKNDDLVIDIKRKLSKIIYKHYKNMLFVCRNEILFDDKLINNYNIESNQFVLWFEEVDCVRYSNDDSDIIKCITIIDNYNDDEYFVNMNKFKTVRMLKSIISRKYGFDEEEFYLEFNKNNLSIDNDATLEQCGLLNDGCRIDLITKIRFDLSKVKRELSYQRPIFFAQSGRVTSLITLIPLTTGYEINVSTECDLSDLIIKICTKCRTQSSLINWYSDADKINKITNNQYLRDFYKKIPDNNKIIIYYEIISE